MKTALKFLSDRSGATAIEYGLIVALVALVLIVAVMTIGTEIGNTFNSISNSF
ncbi:MAG: Flp family type IVb pilin [Rhodospirillaceae bacterium]|jgi:pilus assembly protein Flp/PilA|nr:Flp family type IVb pilin [Rhodospirillaceae bacterium]MBT3910379.1 Flp family type IVb pilin [Rhodospirillaceae bacterium]MBT5298364.1 Flp family type IVb pilin [Rhodospirillaceae bacterium]MBT5512693.1 Flp family type IVb pilin [Rhodospirillaceae bacterium]MBT6086853.1 Flp family type IVb pilin [Rhodospirillaceae bacterium]